MESHNFKVPIGKGPKELRVDFYRFLTPIPLSSNEEQAVLNAFDTEVLPNLERTIALIGGGSHVNFSKVLKTSVGDIVIGYDTTKKGLFSRFISMLGMN